jgi:hypothetical protein
VRALLQACVASALTVAISTPASAGRERRGGIAFHYATPLSSRELAWYARFSALVTHDPLPREQVDYLHRAGTRLLLYEWSVAFYGDLAPAGDWHRDLLETRPWALLNVSPLRGHLGSESADAFYYDPAAKEHVEERPRRIAAKLRSLGYDGVFLDTTTVESVHPDALAEFKKRHAGLAYDDAFAQFMRNLRRELRHGLIATNQGYRKKDRYLPYVDWDISESLITWPREGRFVFRPWNDPKDPWNSIAFLMRKLIDPARRKYPNVRFAHLNYVDAPRPGVTTAIIAVARLFGDEAFVATTEVAGDPVLLGSPAYFASLGRAAGPVNHEDDTAWRSFARGVVAVNAGHSAMRIPNLSRNAYEVLDTDEVTSARILEVPAPRTTGIGAAVFLREEP